MLNKPVKPLPFTSKELVTKDVRDTYKGEYLDKIAFPLGGIGTGSISLGAPGANRVIGITTTTATAGVNGADGSYVTVIDFPEGTGCPFEAGDAVSLTVTNGGGGDQSYYDFSHKCVASVNNSAGVNGYFGTRCIINNNYGVGYAHTALSSSNYAELRGSFKVACLTSTGSGNAYIQQVQVSGDT